MTRAHVFVGLDVALLATIASVSVWAATSLAVASPTLIPLAITIDLVVTATVAHYLLGVRGAGLPKWTVAVVGFAGAAAARWLLPDAVDGTTLLLLLGAVEGGLALFTGWRMFTLFREARHARRQGLPLYETAEHALTEALESKPLARAVLLEVQLLTLGFVGPFRKTQVGPSLFSVHRESGWTWIAALLVGISFIEVPVLHLLLDHFVASWAAWIATFLGIYGALWIWGDAQAMRLRPTRVEDGKLKLRVGLRWAADIPLGLIRSVQPWTDEPEEGDLDVSVFGSGNVRVELRREVVVEGPFGITRKGGVIVMQADDVAGLIGAIGG